MNIDVHAHHIPPTVLERLKKDGASFGVEIAESGGVCSRECGIETGIGAEIEQAFGVCGRECGIWDGD